MTIPVLSRDDVEPLLDWGALADALAEGHRGSRATVADQFLHRDADTLLSRAAWIDGLGIAVKSVSVYPGNPAAGRPSVQGALLLFDDATGAVEAVVDNALVTRWKTAADSLLGARLLARADARRLLILGAGPVAESLIEAYRSHWPDIGISLWNRTPEKAQAMADRLRLSAVSDLADAVGRADIVASATMARQPVLKGEWLRPGQHVDLIGAFTADMREADDTALRRARIFVDSRETTLDHIGELRIPLAEGAISRDDMLGDLYDLCNGAPGRVSDQDITLYKNGGGAHLDLMTGRHILKVWRAAAERR